MRLPILHVLVFTLLTGMGQAQDIAVVDTGPSLVPDGALATDASRLNRFPKTIFGQSSDRQFDIFNDSLETALELSSIEISGPNAEDFQILPSGETLPDSIAPLSVNNESHYFILRWTPAGLGERSALITVVSNDPDGQEGIYTFEVAGECISTESALPDLHVAPQMPMVKMIKGDRLKVQGYVEVWNTGVLDVKRGSLEIYHTSKRYLDESAELIDIRRLKKAPIRNGKGEPRIKRYRYSFKVPDPGVPNYDWFPGCVFAVVRPEVPTTEDAEWYGNIGGYAYDHPTQE